MLETIATAVGLALSIAGTFVAVSRFYASKLKAMIEAQKDAARKEYAAERDFQHLQRNYQQLQTAVDQLAREIDLKIDRLELRFARVETLMRVLSVKVTGETPSKLLDDT
ncbi:hypothetical protein P7L53_12065 [Thermoleptolyngbya sichuanensis XZ-Cy5]|uniref:hypothetical protein n=1 Tax=Thermoleptolyngbya sichuanensis TaxID=2885951 RepID=UPI00240E055E|nr:hypothetical protein [Thermoleptolyngbya sichuanensis]MDG2616975.1 hypothetical protein [Thermoleptolyngbya sichuanensis XZ-Cy5]